MPYATGVMRMIPVPITRSRLIQPKRFGEVRRGAENKEQDLRTKVYRGGIAVRSSASRTELDIHPIYRAERGAQEGTVRGNARLKRELKVTEREAPHTWCWVGG